jgi:hypothetical protein
MRKTALLVAIAAAIPIVVAGQQRPGPRIPYEDPGACPGEGCVYRQWIAQRAVPVHKTRDLRSPILFTLTPGEKADALTGIVVTTKPGVVRFLKNWRIPVSQERYGDMRAKPGDVMYLLTYEAEGESVVWFKGQTIGGVDIVPFMNCGTLKMSGGRNVSRSPDCVADVFRWPESVWWVQIKNQRGQLGWTNRAVDFGNRDALGD